MPPRILFTADTHWHHRATLGDRLGLNRPFATIEDHDEALIERWNAAVRPQDTVWHLGASASAVRKAWRGGSFRD